MHMQEATWKPRQRLLHQIFVSAGCLQRHEIRPLMAIMRVPLLCSDYTAVPFMNYPHLGNSHFGKLSHGEQVYVYTRIIYRIPYDIHYIIY